VRRLEYEQQLSAELTKLKELTQERKDGAAQLKTFELRMHRGSELSEEQQHTVRELKETVSHLPSNYQSKLACTNDVFLGAITSVKMTEICWSNVLGGGSEC
jgi:hypothetical protein